jgi:hypothetical protein
MHSRYLLLKCVPSGAEISEQPSRILRLSELEQLVKIDTELRWGIDPRGEIPVRNSDGSTVKMRPFPGFSFDTLTGSPAFFICYEFYGGLAIHPEGDKRVHEKARAFAESLGAQLFVI